MRYPRSRRGRNERSSSFALGHGKGKGVGRDCEAGGEPKGGDLVKGGVGGQELAKQGKGGGVHAPLPGCVSCDSLDVHGKKRMPEPASSSFGEDVTDTMVRNARRIEGFWSCGGGRRHPAVWQSAK